MWIPYIKLIFLLFVIKIRISQSHDDYVIDQGQEYLRKSDLIVLLKSLEKLIKFTTFFKIKPTLNFVFGIFMISVNLERAVIIDDHDIEFSTRQYMKHLLQTNNRNLNVFTKDMVKLVNEHDMEIFVHMNPNVLHWANRISEFGKPSQKPYVLTKEQTIPWKEYNNKISNYESDVPSPKMSDKCLASIFYSLALSEKSNQCEVDQICYYIILNGTNSGYALTHRLLPLLIARLGHDCNIFSLQEDVRQAKKFCSDIYKDALKIAQNNYSSMDLLMEQIALCSLNGHALFFHRSWFAEILKYQNIDGCFSDYRANTKTSERNEDLSEFKEYYKYSYCGEHITSVAAGSLSAAIRFIVEKFY